MKRTKTHAGLLALLSLVFFLISSCTQGPADVTQKIQEANNAFMKTIESGDATALAMHYTSNAKLLPANGAIIEGREAIEAHWSKALEMGMEKPDFKTLEALQYGDVVIEEGLYTIYAGGQVADQGKYIVTWEKEEGQWKLHRDIWNSSMPAPLPRASENETVWVVWNRIKADKVSQFEEFTFNYLEPAIAENYPRTRNTIRALRPKEANEDGTFTYFYLMDPADSPDGYGMAKFLTTQYGKEKSDEYLEMFRDCLVDKQEWVFTAQTKW